MTATVRKEAGTWGLIMACLGAIVGSGWLFGPLHAAQTAGPLSLVSWLLGGAAVLLLAFVYAELATVVAVSGAVVHLPHLSHGSLLGRMFAWNNFLAYVIVGPIEAMAVLSYLNNVHPGLTGAGGVLTPLGYVLAILMLAAFTLLNFLGIRRVLAINNWAMGWKLAVPVVTALALPFLSWHPQNLALGGDRAPASWQGMFQALATSGVVFSFLGFRQAVELAGEARDPGRTLPRAIVGSVLVGVALYTGLQLAFLLALDPSALRGGWAHLKFAGMAGPFAGLAASVGALWLAAALYVDAFVSPGGTGFIYQTTAMRVIQAMSAAGQLPPAAGRLNRGGVPWVAGLIAFAAGLVLLLPFPSWQRLVGAVSSIAILAYSVGPVTLIVLRRELPGIRGAFRLPAARWLAPLAFVVSNLIIYWTGPRTVTVLTGFLLAVLFLFVLRDRLRGRLPLARQRLRRVAWVPFWYAGLVAVAWLGDRAIGGRGWLPFPCDIALLGVFSLVVLAWAVSASAPAEEIRDYLDRLGAERQAEAADAARR